MAERSHPAGLRVKVVALPWRSSSHHAPTTMDSLGHAFLAVIDVTAPTRPQVAPARKLDLGSN